MNSKKGGSLASNRVHRLLKGDCKKGGKRSRAKKSKSKKRKVVKNKTTRKTGKRSRVKKRVSKSRKGRIMKGGGNGTEVLVKSTSQGFGRKYRIYPTSHSNLSKLGYSKRADLDIFLRDPTNEGKEDFMNAFIKYMWETESVWSNELSRKFAFLYGQDKPKQLLPEQVNALRDVKFNNYTINPNYIKTFIDYIISNNTNYVKLCEFIEKQRRKQNNYNYNYYSDRLIISLFTPSINPNPMFELEACEADLLLSEPLQISEYKFKPSHFKSTKTVTQVEIKERLQQLHAHLSTSVFTKKRKTALEAIKKTGTCLLHLKIDNNKNLREWYYPNSKLCFTYDTKLNEILFKKKSVIPCNSDAF
jgi:hypothetical protein